MLDRDERAEYAAHLRALRREEATFGTPLVWLDELADALEAEPDQIDRLTAERDEARADLVITRRRRSDAMDALEALPEGAREWTVGYDAGRAQERKENTAALDEAREALRDLVEAHDLPAMRAELEEQQRALASFQTLAQLPEQGAEIAAQGRYILNLKMQIGALEHAHALLEGVERTHTLVPTEVIDITGEIVAAFARLGERSGVSADTTRRFTVLGERLSAAARGEHAEWPA